MNREEIKYKIREIAFLDESANTAICDYIEKLLAEKDAEIISGRVKVAIQKNRIAELGSKIDKMKCHGNCTHGEIADYSNKEICTLELDTSKCSKCSKWELAE